MGRSLLKIYINLIQKELKIFPTSPPAQDLGPQRLASSVSIPNLITSKRNFLTGGLSRVSWGCGSVAR